jgi:hypothetical protein
MQDVVTKDKKTKLSNNFIQIALMAFLYFLFGKLSFIISSDNQIVTIVIFFAEGISLAGALIFGRAIIMGVFLGQLLLAISSNLAFIPSLLISAINAIELFIAIYLFDKFNLKRSLDSLRDVFGLSILILFVLQPFSAIFGNLVLYIFDIVSTQKLFYSV